MPDTRHVPILVEPIVTALIEPFRGISESEPAHWLVDCTLGGGGHTAAFLDAFARDPKLARHKIAAFDQDPAAISRAKTHFEKEIAEGRLEIHHARFSGAAEFLKEKSVLGLMADLGFSSDQVDEANRGLSFMADAPLDMRMDPTHGISCREYLFHVSEDELERVLREYGEERFSRRISSTLIQARRENRLPTTTKGLSTMIVHAIPSGARHGRIHAATRSFQALRIAVNDELKELDSLLRHVIIEVRPRGRVAILSFHSLEDREVKHAFKDSPLWHPLTKKPVEAPESELSRNPRSRSAKLRIAERTRE